MKRIFTVAALFVAVSITSFAQNVTTFGLRAGLSVAKLGADAETDGRAGLHIGAVADIPLATNIYLEPGLLFNMKGAKADIARETLKLSLNYIEMPIVGVYKYHINNDIAVRGNFGPYFAVGVGGKGKLGDYKVDSFGDDGYKRFDMGLNFGAGVEYQCFMFNFGYDLGLVNLNDGGNSKAKTRSFLFSLGYNF